MAYVERHERRLLALGGERVPMCGYGLPLLDRPGTVEGLYFIAQSRSESEACARMLGDLFRCYYIVESNRTHEWGFVARVEVEEDSRTHIRPHQPDDGWPDYNHLGELVAMPPNPRIRVGWVPAKDAWIANRVACAGGTAVDLRELSRVVARHPKAEPVLTRLFRAIPALPYEENRRHYLSQLAALGATDRYLRDRYDELKEAFASVASPEPEA